MDSQSFSSSYSNTTVIVFTAIAAFVFFVCYGLYWLIFKRNRQLSYSPITDQQSPILYKYAQNHNMDSVSIESNFEPNKVSKEENKDILKEISIAFRPTSVDLDSSINYLLLAFILLSEAFIEIFTIFTPTNHKKKKDLKKSIQSIRIKSQLYEASEKELRSILQNVDFLDSLSKNDLVKLVSQSDVAINSFNLSKRRSVLLQKTNQQLKLQLKGVPKIAGLKKSELVELIIKNENY